VKKCVTYHAKTFLTPFSNEKPFGSRLSAVQTDWDAVGTALAVCSKKFPCHAFQKILAVQSNKKNYAL